MTESSLFRSVDVAAFVAALAERLREAGVVVGLSSISRCSNALVCCPPTDTSTLYWVTRTCLVHDRSDFATFDAVFAAAFHGDGLPIGPWQRDIGDASVRMAGTLLRQSAPSDGLALAAGRVDGGRRPEIIDEGNEADESVDGVLPELLPAAIERLADTPFDQLSSEDLDLLGRWLEEMMVRFPTRTSRRHAVSPTGGGIDLRRTLAAARATGAEPIHLARRRRRQRARRVVMVADVSGSMESFTRIHLHLMRTLVVRGSAEVFTFATSLRRVTVQLRDGDPQVAIDRLALEVSDRFGGTRIAASIGELIHSPVWSHVVRGATVIIASDGWDTESPDELGRRMARLKRLAHRVIWVNPRSAAAEYEPLVGGMAAALPHVDELLSGHSLEAMRPVISALAT